jgi:flavin-dependent dehydrogenase
MGQAADRRVSCEGEGLSAVAGVAGKDPNLFHWTRLSTTTAPLRREGAPPELAGMEPVGRAKGPDVTWRLLEACAGPGYFVAGDAASASDPSSSHGVLRALMSGMLAAHLVLRKTLYNDPEPALSAEYRHFLRSSFEVDWVKASKLFQLTSMKIERKEHK